MDIPLLVFKVALLGGLPLAVLLGICQANHYWPVALFTFVGTTICAINLRTAGVLAKLPERPNPILGRPPAEFYNAVAWVVCPLLLIIGLRKLLRLRRAQALARLLAESDPD